jgi:hypothetical protein
MQGDETGFLFFLRQKSRRARYPLGWDCDKGISNASTTISK